MRSRATAQNSSFRHLLPDPAEIQTTEAYDKLISKAKKALKNQKFHKATDYFLDAFCEFSLTSDQEKWHSQRWHSFCLFCWMFTSGKTQPKEEDLETLSDIKRNRNEVALVRIHASETLAWLLGNVYEQHDEAMQEYQYALQLGQSACENCEEREKQTVSGKLDTRCYGMKQEIDDHDVRLRFIGDILDSNLARIKFVLKAIEDDDDYFAAARAAAKHHESSQSSTFETQSENDKGGVPTTVYSSKPKKEKKHSHSHHHADHTESSEEEHKKSTHKHKKKHSSHTSSSSSHKKKSSHSHKKLHTKSSSKRNMSTDFTEATENSSNSSASGEMRDSSLMKVKEIKRELESFGVNTGSFIERGELVNALEQARASSVAAC
mmetsp:Transcript_1997/g.4847  ORF Transcript_1997/g.4847 Transcript_1997/m.4847 type:complete len:378 (+) Transcript_1997:181-1314(+)|eukprot:CAMPEP_0168789316 /NCGR_PEP_ID=MMETSP0725-20121227/12788_1 /TAXON_ID=265536 /ORGANISM="Amphiprora sp., Strain CCMP467" /LENGTH=377 /DNA_ID=CAMNT_0008839619 /DNA_START=88 /DNA_END=1221 /DNA_ORIENTATION=+